MTTPLKPNVLLMIKGLCGMIKTVKYKIILYEKNILITCIFCN